MKFGSFALSFVNYPEVPKTAQKSGVCKGAAPTRARKYLAKDAEMAVLFSAPPQLQPPGARLSILTRRRLGNVITNAITKETSKSDSSKGKYAPSCVRPKDEALCSVE